jgi:phosphatidate cytidylyltransferase
MPPGATQPSRNLVMRVLAAAVLAPLTIALAYAGGWFWIVLVTLATIGMYGEWLAIVGALSQIAIAAVGIAALAVSGIAFALHSLGIAIAAIAAGLIALALSAERDVRRWVASGLLYAGLAQTASVLVRHDRLWGFSALLYVLLIVWATDIGGYFAGRRIGGPKLWVRVSPKKTWAGAVGGLAGSLVVAAGFAMAGQGRIGPLLSMAAVLSIISQLGDLFESAVKRRFGVKDSSNIIPGHGGLLDRLDGFVAAIVLAAVIGLVRGGVDGVGRGLMVW